MTNFGFLFACANTPWVYGLCNSLAERGHPSIAITLHDWATFKRLGPTWPKGIPPSTMVRENWVMPPGYMWANGRSLPPVSTLEVEAGTKFRRRKYQTALDRLCIPLAVPADRR